MVYSFLAKFWAYIVAAGVIAALGWLLVQKIEQAALAEARADASEEARIIEKKRQKGINNAYQKQIDDMAAINGTLSADLERLRDRPARVPGAGTDCKGTTGAELSRSDSEFLTRLASRADTLRAALTACYTYADSLQEK